MKQYISIEESESYSTIKINAPVTMDTGADIEEQILKVFDALSSNIAIDLINSQVIFSAGMGLLARLNELAIKQNKSIYIINPTARVFEALESLGITKLIETFETENEFINFLK